MTPAIIVKLIFLFTGALSVLAGLLNWKWFIHSQNAAFLRKRLGEGPTRIFYILMGAVMIGMAMWVIK